MMKDIVAQFPSVRKLLNIADNTLRISLSKLMTEGNEVQ
jgi:hypothetical protein